MRKRTRAGEEKETGTGDRTQRKLTNKCLFFLRVDFFPILSIFSRYWKYETSGWSRVNIADRWAERVARPLSRVGGRAFTSANLYLKSKSLVKSPPVLSFFCLPPPMAIDPWKVPLTSRPFYPQLGVRWVYEKYNPQLPPGLFFRHVDGSHLHPAHSSGVKRLLNIYHAIEWLNDEKRIYGIVEWEKRRASHGQKKTVFLLGDDQKRAQRDFSWISEEVYPLCAKRIHCRLYNTCTHDNRWFFNRLHTLVAFITHIYIHTYICVYTLY